MIVFVSFTAWQTSHIKRQFHKIVKHTKTVRRLLPTTCLIVFNHFVELALKGTLMQVWKSANIFSSYEK